MKITIFVTANNRLRKKLSILHTFSFVIYKTGVVIIQNFKMFLLVYCSQNKEKATPFLCSNLKDF